MKEMSFWRGVFSVLLMGIGVAFFYSIWGVLLPFLFGFIIAYLLNPLVEKIVAAGFRRDRITLILYVIILTLCIFLGMQYLPDLIRQMNSAMANLPQYAKELDKVIAVFNVEIQEKAAMILGKKAHDIVIPIQMESLTYSLFHKLPSNILNVAHLGFWIFIIPFVSFFALSQGKKWIDQLFDLTPANYVESLLGFMAEVNATLGGYVRGILLESMIVGIVTIVGLMALGVKGALLIGFITGLINVVPFMGIVIGGGIAMLAGFYQTGSVSLLSAIFILYGSVRLLDDFFIIPFVMGRNVKLHPVVALFAILAGVELGGFLGLIFAIPAAAVIKVFLSLLLRNRQDHMVLRSEHVYS